MSKREPFGIKNVIPDKLYDSCASIYLRLKQKTQLVEVPIEICSNHMGFSYGKDGWHYLIECLKEFDQDENLKPEDSILFRFYQYYQPTSTFDMVGHKGNDVKFSPLLGIYPWGTFRTESSKDGGSPKNRFTSRHVGPSDLNLVRNTFYNLLSLYKDIRLNGYRPWDFKRAFVGGTFLKKSNGQLRYIILQGNHRTAILSHLGHKSVLTRYLQGHYRLIDERDVSNWYYVKTGECSVDDALAYFNAFFEVNGIERAIRIGLI